MKVFHANPVDRREFCFIRNAEALDALFTAKGVTFVHVATVVEAETLGLHPTSQIEHAFEKTNTIDQAWYRAGVVSLVGPCRSTSVGDLIEHNGIYYMVAPYGWDVVHFDPTSEA